MRSMKRIIALAMVAMMLVAACALNTFASEEADYSEAAKNLGAIKIMKGDTNGNLMLDQGVTRYQAALFFVQALTGETEVEKWNADKQSEVFTDVPEYGTAIDYANGIGLIRGRGDSTYGYNDPITYQDMLVLAVRALGYETDKMAYPAGYLLAAKKLKLTEKLADGIQNTQALTRGETAQIIWNMLSVDIAVVDPLTGKVLYPNEESSSDGILGGTIKRTNLLEEVGFSRGVIEDVIDEYKEAKLSSDIATVVLKNSGIEIAASELGITARTTPSTFLGLPVTLYVDCLAGEFEKLYSVIEEESEANIIFADMLDFTNVVNIGEQTNIKVVERDDGEIRVTLGENTYGKKYNIEIYTLDEDDGWKLDVNTDFYDNFLYEDDKFVGNNSYGEVDFAVIADEEAKIYKVMVLYKPYEFGQYFTRTIRYQPTVSDESFITIGKYNGGASYVENFAGDDSYFVETLLGSGEEIITPSGEKITSVSKSSGEAARDARLAGESVRSGDFIFYYYNALDNVLNIGYNCGALKSGNLTSKSDKAETVKIDGVTYTYAIPGAFTFPAGKELPVYNGTTIADKYLSAMVNGEKNVQYVAVDDNVLYIQTPLNGSNYRAKHNYIITTTKADVMADLLGLEKDEYAAEIADTEGVYLSDNGYITIAVLNTANGKWELAEIAQFECGADQYGRIQVSGDGDKGYAFDHKENKFAFKFDLKKELANYFAFGNLYNDKDNVKAVIAEILKGGLFAVRGKSGNVYNISAMFDTGDWGMIDNAKEKDGLYFSDTAPKTNKIEASRKESVEPARVTLTDSTVIVVIDKEDNVGVRVGIQGSEDSIIFSGTSDSVPGGFFYSATNKLIVLKFYKHSSVKVTHEDGTTFDVEKWADAPKAGSDETYYVGLSEAGVEYSKLDDDTYEFTVTGLFNLRTMRAVSAIKLSIDDLSDTNLDDKATLVGKVIEMDKHGKLNVKDTVTVEEALVAALNMDADNDDEKVVSVDLSVVGGNNVLQFVDDCSITAKEFGLDADEAIAEINATVITLDVTGLDLEKYDIERLALNEVYDEDNKWGATSVEYAKNVDYFAYDIGSLDSVEKITEPMAGILDQYILDKAGAELFIAGADDSYFEDAEKLCVNLYAAGNFDKEDGVLTLYVVKLLDKAQ